MQILLSHSPYRGSDTQQESSGISVPYKAGCAPKAHRLCSAGAAEVQSGCWQCRQGEAPRGSLLPGQRRGLGHVRERQGHNTTLRSVRERWAAERLRPQLLQLPLELHPTVLKPGLDLGERPGGKEVRLQLHTAPAMAHTQAIAQTVVPSLARLPPRSPAPPRAASCPPADGARRPPGTAAAGRSSPGC